MIYGTKLGRYFNIFMCIVSQPRCTITRIAKNIGHTGIGRRRATVSTYVNDMYKNKISLKPNLVLNDFQNLQWKAYFCKKTDRSKLSATFEMLRNNKKINYVVFISGDCDFFLTSRDPALDLKQYDIDIVESSSLYSPIFTIPQGWNLSFENASKIMLKCNFEKGSLLRKAEGTLNWGDLDMRIFELMRENARRPFTEVSAHTDVYSSTIKDHFYKHVLPCCKVAHYFFPNGYDAYMQGFFKIQTKYEESVVRALRKLPCTTYIYPLENELLINLFHENINIVMTVIGKMEENGIIERYALFTPLWYKHI